MDKYSYADILLVAKQMFNSLPVIQDNENVPDLSFADLATSKWDKEIAQATLSFFVQRKWSRLTNPCRVHLALRLRFAEWLLINCVHDRPGDWFDARHAPMIIASVLTDTWHKSALLWLYSSSGAVVVFGSHGLASVRGGGSVYNSMRGAE